MRTPDGAGQVGHLHHAQAERGARGRRPDHRPAPREADRDAPGRGRDRGEPRAPDGRPRRPAARRQDAGRSPPSRCSRSRISSVYDDRGIEKVRGVSFEVRAGEIVGIAGIDGNGQTELIDALDGAAGRRPAARCASTGEDVTTETPPGHLEAGLGHIPEDRQRRGLVLEYSIAENIALHDYRLAARVALRLALPAPAGRARAQADQGVRRPRRRPDDPAGGALRRQPAEGRARARDRARPARC